MARERDLRLVERLPAAGEDLLASVVKMPPISRCVVIPRWLMPRSAPDAYGLLSAIPTVEDIRSRRRLSVIEGDVPDLSRLGRGCQFVSRCSVIPPGEEERCSEKEPELEKVGLEHRVRCWLHVQEGART